MIKTENNIRQLNGILLLILLLFSQCVIAQDIARFDFEDLNASSITTEKISGAVFSVYNHFNHPERISGIHGNALRLDGYSTWAVNSTLQLSGITNKITVSAWYATEAFNKETGAIISQIDGLSGFALEVGSYGNIGLTYFIDGIKKNLQSVQKIEKYTWNYIVARIDLENSKAQLFVNGVEWASNNYVVGNKITLGSAALYLGRHNNDIRNDGFLLTALNGAIDDVVISKDILSNSQILSNFQQNNTLVPNLTINPDLRYAGDYFRPQYHAIPNSSWTNEPYGLIFYNGKYHLFFQKNPNSPTLYFMHWGHLTSSDLVNWTEEKIVLAPSSGFDSFGIWSGSTILGPNNTPKIIYTGVDGVKAGIGTADPLDEQLQGWEKNSLNPIIPNAPASSPNMDFRDPFVWKSGDYYYMIVGSGIKNNLGGILFTFKSKDLVQWTEISPVYYSSSVNDSGIFWEMPFFIPMSSSNEYMLGVTPVPTPGFPAQTIYWIGKWENETFTPSFSIPKNLELINGHLLSPAFNFDTSGRATYLGIIPEERDAASQIQGEWRHLFSLPRAIRLLNDSSIGQVPHPNLCRLRDTPVSISKRVITPGTGNNIPEIQGVQSEFSFQIKADESSKFSIQVYKNTSGSEFTTLFFDLANNKIALDRTQSSLLSGPAKDYKSSDYIFNYKDTLFVDVFLDHSTLEVFVDKITVFSCRVYPSAKESNNVDLIVNSGKAEIIWLDAWNMKKMGDVSTQDICEQPNLPSQFRKVEITTGIPDIVDNRLEMRLYPNPAKQKINLEFDQNQSGKIQIMVCDILGRAVLNKTINFLENSLYTLDISMLNAGIYVLKADGEKQYKPLRIVKSN